MTDKLVELARYENPLQAETIRIALQEEGVAAFIENSEVNRTMHYVGTALGSVRVMVPESILPRAQELLEELSASTVVQSPPWICGECGEEVEGGFDECWSCGAARGDDARPASPPPLAPTSFSDAKQTALDTTAPAPDDSPYHSPTYGREPGQASQLPEDIEATLHRAWLASIIGLFLCPFGLHLYSAYLLLGAREDLASRPGLQPSPSLRRKVLIAKVINWLVILVTLAMAASLFFSRSRR